MRLQTDNNTRRFLIACMIGCIFLCPARMMGQSATTNHAIEYWLIESYNDAITDLHSVQTQYADTTAAAATATTVLYYIMGGWERKYNEYLKDNTFANAMTAGVNLYAEGTKTLFYINELRKVVKNNPEGIIATAALNNLYVEVAVDLLRTFRTLKYCVGAGGSENMLTGAERAKMFLRLADELHQMNAKLQKLTLSIGYYNLLDVKDRAIRPIIRHDKMSAAKESLKGWRRAYRSIR